jgi:tetratricopeptide (TPR) repeat protein
MLMRTLHRIFVAIASVSLVTIAPAQKTNPADADFAAGLSNLQAKKFPEADAAFGRVVQKEPNGLRGYLGVVQVLMAQQKTSKALAYLRAELEKQPLRMDLHVVLGDTAARAGQYDAAVTEFQTVLARVDPKEDSEIDVPRGAPNALLLPFPQPDPLTQSITILAIKDQTPKGATGLHLRLAEVYRLKNDQDSSIAEWQKVSEALPKTPWVMANLGMAQEAGGRKGDAMKTYREVLAVMPRNPLVMNNLAFLIAETGGDLREAQQYAHRAASLAPGSLDINDTEGWIALKMGYVDDALGTFTRVLTRRPGSLEVRKHLAMALVQKGRHSTAIDALIQALNAPKADGDEQKLLDLMRKASVPQSSVQQASVHGQ